MDRYSLRKKKKKKKGREETGEGDRRVLGRPSGVL